MPLYLFIGLMSGLFATGVEKDPAWGCNEWHADNGQDRFVYDHFHSYLDLESHQPFFVEAGANDGLTSSNTAALDLCFGWHGLLIEPDPRVFFKIGSNRPRSVAYHGCLSDRNEDVTLSMVDDDANSIYEGALSTVATGDDASPQDVRSQSYKKSHVSVKCYTLGELLAKSNVKTVDYLSLDVEGYELKALQGIDWEQGPDIRLISLEMNILMPQPHHDDLIGFLAEKGYRLLMHLGDDAIYHRHEPQRNFGHQWVDCSGGLLQPLQEEVEKSFGHTKNFVQALEISRAPPAQLGKMMEQWIATLKHNGKREKLGDTAQAEFTVFYALGTDFFSRWCPLGFLTARFIASLYFGGLTLLKQVVTHAIVYSDAQIARILQQPTPKTEVLYIGWVTKCPLPEAFLASLDFVLVLQSPWPIFQALDAVSHKVRLVAEHEEIQSSFSRDLVCAGMGTINAGYVELGILEACGMLTTLDKSMSTGGLPQGWGCNENDNSNPHY